MSVSNETSRAGESSVPWNTTSYGSISNSPRQVNKDTHGVEILKKNGIGVLSAAVFIAGEMAGSGVLVLPRVVVDSGWIGLILIIILCVTSCYGGTRLGLCWDIIEERFPQYQGSTRSPYPTIAEKAVGRWGRNLVSACVQITLFGAGVVYLLLASQMFQELLEPFIPNVTYCSWFLLFALMITPPMWLGSPKDFLIVGVGALLTTAIACILIFSQIVIDGIHTDTLPSHVPHGFKDFFTSFGIILFSFGGASIFPTIQNDMRDRKQFSKSILIGFIAILLMYLPITYGGYFVYGESTQANIILSLKPSLLAVLANICMVAHLVLAFLILINPVAQEIENIFDVPHEFCILRCVVRTCMVLLMVVVGETIPQFSKIITLVGGSTVTLLTFVLPNLFYMKLCDQESTEWPKRKIPLHMRVFMWELIAIGLVGGAAATYSAFHSIFSGSSISKPCYWL